MFKNIISLRHDFYFEGLSLRLSDLELNAFLAEIESFIAMPIDGEFSGFINWFDNLIELNNSVLHDADLQKIHDHLKIKVGYAYLRSDAQRVARASNQFLTYIDSIDDSSTNVYLFRDSFALYTADKIKGHSHKKKAMFISKTVFRRFNELKHQSDGLIYKIIEGAKVEIGYKLNDLIPEDEYLKFRENFILNIRNQLELSLEEHERSGVLSPLLKASEHSLHYMHQLGLFNETSGSIRFIDTTMTGSFPLFLEAISEIYFERTGASVDVSTQMFYSKLSPAISFLPQMRLGQARKTEIPAKVSYPIEFSGKLGQNGLPEVNDLGNKEQFVFFMILLKNELLKLSQ